MKFFTNYPKLAPAGDDSSDGGMGGGMPPGPPSDDKPEDDDSGEDEGDTSDTESDDSDTEETPDADESDSSDSSEDTEDDLDEDGLTAAQASVLSLFTSVLVDDDLEEKEKLKKQIESLGDRCKELWQALQLMKGSGGSMSDALLQKLRELLMRWGAKSGDLHKGSMDECDRALERYTIE